LRIFPYRYLEVLKMSRKSVADSCSTPFLVKIPESTLGYITFLLRMLRYGEFFMPPRIKVEINPLLILLICNHKFLKT